MVDLSPHVSLGCLFFAYERHKLLRITNPILQVDNLSSPN